MTRIEHAAFAAGHSLLASKDHVYFVDPSLRLRATLPVDGIVCCIAVSTHAEHAAIALRTGTVLVWNTQTGVPRTVIEEVPSSPEDALMAAIFQEGETPGGVVRLAVSDDGASLALLRNEAGGGFTLECLGDEDVSCEVASVHPGMRLSIGDVVVLGPCTYARDDLRELARHDECIADIGDAALLRNDEDELMLRVGTRVTSLGRWDGGGFAGDEVVLVRLRRTHRRRPTPRSLEVRRLSLSGDELSTRLIPWEPRHPSDVYEEWDALCDCAHLRGLVHEDENVRWVDLRTAEHLGVLDLDAPTPG